MHILFLTQCFPPEVNTLATRSFEHCRRWVQAGHQVTVITGAPTCPNGIIFPGYRNAWRREEQVEGIRVIRSWTYLVPHRGFVRRVLHDTSYMLTATLHAARVRNVDLIVATAPQLLCGWAGVLVKWLKRKPFVLEIADPWHDSTAATASFRSSWVMRTWEWLEARMYRAARHIVTVGNDYRRSLVAKGVPWNKVSVVSNGIALDDFRFGGNRDEVRAGYGFNGKFVCGYVGTVGTAQGLEVMLDAAEIATKQGRHDLLFWIVGDGARRAELQADAERRGLKNVVFAGLMPKEAIPAVIAACDACLVHLRGIELFSKVLPAKIFEMMALEVPIICGVRGQAEEIVCESGAGVAMTPDVAAELLDRIEIIQSAGRDSFGARDYLARHFDRDRLAATMLDELKKHAGIPTLDTTQEIQLKKLRQVA